MKVWYRESGTSLSPNHLPAAPTELVKVKESHSINLALLTELSPDAIRSTGNSEEPKNQKFQMAGRVIATLEGACAPPTMAGRVAPRPPPLLLPRPPLLVPP
jgi:hypothetical protein